MTKRAANAGRVVGKTSGAEGITLVGEGKYPLVALNCIDIVDRPTPGEDKLFYNPRSLESFDEDEMRDLREAIQMDGLQTPLSVRAINNSKIIEKIELIAGERRLRCLLKLVEQDAPCYNESLPPPARYKVGQFVIFDSQIAVVDKANGKYTVTIDGKQHTAEYEDLLPTTSASELYAMVPCKVNYDCNDERALRLSCSENIDHKPLTIKEEVELVERLVAAGYKQRQICAMVCNKKDKKGNNVTWVSQTASFRTELPPSAFQSLMIGNLTRSGASDMLGYAFTDRQTLHDVSVAQEEKERKETIEMHQNAQEHFEDHMEIEMGRAKKAEQVGDEEEAAKSTRRAEINAAKAKKAEDKKAYAIANAGKITKGHIRRGAAAAGIKPKKAKLLPKMDIETMVETLKLWEKKGQSDSITGKKYPPDYVLLVRLTAQAILGGEHDPSEIIRNFMVQTDRWEIKGHKYDLDDIEDADLKDDEEDTKLRDAFDDEDFQDEDAVLADSFADYIEDDD